MYNELKFNKLIPTISKLETRIADRFPGSGLLHVCQGLHTTAVDAQKKVLQISKPNQYIRFGVLCAVIIFAVLLIYSISLFEWEYRKPDVMVMIQLTEAVINEMILLGAAIFFLVSLEVRAKRKLALRALHELRSMAHVVDMHQLTKDPAMIVKGVKSTKHSPARKMSEFELQRYLDYCSEMFSLIGKVAALYSERLPEPEIVSAANDIEQLCTGLSRKVWQKMMMLDALPRAAGNA